MTLAIDVRGLSKRFGDRPAVQDLSIQVEQGRITGFLGPNGSGKTTTLRMLCGLLTPDAGQGTCLGLDLRKEAPAIKRLTGYMTQRFSLYEDLSVVENLNFVGRIYSLPDRPGRVRRCLDRFGLAERRDQIAGSLSGGWKQRLALAACILHEPKLLLLDEPTAGVDPKARREFWDQIHALAAEGLTVLVSTHYMDEAERCHDIAYIAGGRLLARGDVSEVIQRSGLITFRADGPGADRLGSRLSAMPGVLAAAPFGVSLHVSGTDRAALQKAIAPFRGEGLTWREEAPTLEDVAIRLMSEAPDPAPAGA